MHLLVLVLINFKDSSYDSLNNLDISSGSCGPNYFCDEENFCTSNDEHRAHDQSISDMLQNILEFLLECHRK